MDYVPTYQELMLSVALLCSVLEKTPIFVLIGSQRDMLHVYNTRGDLLISKELAWPLALWWPVECFDKSTFIYSNTCFSGPVYHCRPNRFLSRALNYFLLVAFREEEGLCKSLPIKVG